MTKTEPTTFAPGDIVKARGREWIVLPSPDAEWLNLRPLAGAESDIQLLHPALEAAGVKPAQFDPPSNHLPAAQDGARLLSDALKLALRRGAGPFRSAARLSFEPRAYQIVPLLMALRQPTVRLLIADDVGIGKTIEAAMIVRELMDRGEVDRFTVLCPPHLVDQWLLELNGKFDVDAVAVTSSSAARLERGLTASQTIFEAFPFTVVSLDYIKAEKRRASFARSCPRLVVVDEAHACVGTHLGRQQRFELLKSLAADKERHMLMLTATPHSGDEHAFDRLLSLIGDEFNSSSLESEDGRRRLARHFVQRRRIDIVGKEWSETRAFPKHEPGEATYKLDKDHQKFHDAVLDYCLGVVEGAGESDRSRRLAFWGTLALMRCVGSSPAAAASALRNRLAADQNRLEEQVFDDDSEAADAVDIEPASGLPGDKELMELIKQAEALIEKPDPKLAATAKVLKPLVADGANPVVFCRFIATAEHVAHGLRKAFPQVRIEVVTGALPSEERAARVEAMGEAEQRLLVATDCLSEGVNLQKLFDTVVHYDLSWNPTRHQQREGRVDRFGQPKDIVRSILLYSPDSSIDGAVLDVILKKAERIRSATGVTVPLPEERGAVTGALMKAVLLRKGSPHQLSLFDLDAASKEMEVVWSSAEEKEKRSRARFAQNAIKPEEVAPEWRRWRELLGAPEDVERFVSRALSRFNAPLEKPRGGAQVAHLNALPKSIAERLEARQLSGDVALAFEEPTPARAVYAHRTHPIPSILAEALVESALDPALSSIESVGRVGAWASKTVEKLTTIALLRLRFKLTVHAKAVRTLLVEEAASVAFEGQSTEPALFEEDARKRLEAPSEINLADAARKRLIEQGLARVISARDDALARYAHARAEALGKDHARVRDAGAGVSRVTVEAVEPVDIIAVYVIAPAGA